MQTDFDKKSGLAFIIAFGVVSLFADMAYEGMRGISGPFLASLGASGAAVGAIAGTGELFGYLLRLGSGRLVERTRLYWPIALAGYAIQMAAVPALALAGNWWAAALFIILERTGKAVRNPAANTMMSRAGEHIGQGWAFGLHEAMDQTGAMGGPLIAALVLALHHDYRTAFLWLGVPAILTIISVLTVRFRFPYAGHVALPDKDAAPGSALSPAFWFYAVAAAFVAFGFADYPLIAFHFAKANIVSPAVIPVFYASAMGASGLGSLIFGRWFDKSGLGVLIPGLIIGAPGASHLASMTRSCRLPSPGWCRNMLAPALMAFSPPSTASPGSPAAHCWGRFTMFRLWGSSQSPSRPSSLPLFRLLSPFDASNRAFRPFAAGRGKLPPL